VSKIVFIKSNARWPKFGQESPVKIMKTRCWSESDNKVVADRRDIPMPIRVARVQKIRIGYNHLI
jgi:hypothetical protein